MEKIEDLINEVSPIVPTRRKSRNLPDGVLRPGTSNISSNIVDIAKEVEYFETIIDNLVESQARDRK